MHPYLDSQVTSYGELCDARGGDARDAVRLGVQAPKALVGVHRGEALLLDALDLEGGSVGRF